MKRVIAVAAACTCVLLAGCVSNAIRVWGSGNKVPYPLYAGPLHVPETDASILLLTEVDVPGGYTKGWVRVVSVDGVDVAKVPNVWAHLTPGEHVITTKCHSGPFYKDFGDKIQDGRYLLEANKTYSWEIQFVKINGRPAYCESDGVNKPGMDRGHIALVEGM